MYPYYNVENLKPEEVLIYLRKSRSDDPLLSVEEVLQKHETILDEWVEKNLSARIPEENRFREVVSGETIDDRPGVLEVLRLIESPKIKAILTVEVQRLSRGDLEDAGRLIKLLRYTNTIVITPTKIYDLANDEYDRDMFERELKRGNEFLEYQKKILNRGRLQSVSQGNFISSIPPYGYDKVFVTEGKRKSPILVINESQAEIVRLIFDLYVNQDMGHTNICRYLDETHVPPPVGKHWSAHSMRGILGNVHYIGKVKWNSRKQVNVVEDGEITIARPRANDYLVFDGKHEAIISEELFEAALAKIGRNHRTKPSKKLRNPLAGLLYCECGKAMTMRGYVDASGKQPYSYRVCCNDQYHCGNGSCLYSEIINAVVQVLSQKIEEFETLAKADNSDAVSAHTKLIKRLENKLENLRKREISQWEAQSDPDPAKRMPAHIFQALNAKLLAEIETVETTLRNAQNNAPIVTDYPQKIVSLRTALDALLDDVLSAAQKNKFLKACIKRIVYHRDKPQRTSGLQSRRWTDPPIEISVELNV